MGSRPETCAAEFTTKTVTLAPMDLRAGTVTRVLSLLAAFLVTAMVMGLLAAGLMMPAVGATGSLARAGVDTYDSLPAEFRQTTPYQQSRILAADGTVIATPYDQNRIIVPLKSIAPIMRKAQVAIEDDRFYEHGGFDVKGTLRGVMAPLLGEEVRGGSSLTQQFVKMTLQDQALQVGNKEAAEEAASRKVMRKLQELKYATQVEKEMTKDEILAGYLNLAFYGDGAYGVEAASRHYFSKAASKLTLPEAALLAGLVQNPSSTDPVNYPDQALERRNVVLARMLDLKLISDADYKKAKAITLKQMLKVQPDRGSCASATKVEYAYFCDYVINWLKEQPALGKTVAERIKKINTGGLTIQTTLDTKLMKVARDAVVKKVPQGNKYGIGAAAVTIEPGTGKVLSMAQNTTYSVKKGKGLTTLNYAVDRKYGGSSGFSVGSTIKMFTLVAALETGWAASGSVFARGSGPGRPVNPPYTSNDIPGPCGLGPGQVWAPKNDTGISEGNIRITDATKWSINTAFIAIASRVGVCNVREVQKRLDLHTGEGEQLKNLAAATILGTESVSPITIGASYAAIAAEGKYCEPRPVIAVTDAKRKALKLQITPCKQVVDEDVARGVSWIMNKVMLPGGAAQGSPLDRPSAGKTGTAESNTEVWFIGYTPQLATAVWVGTPDNDKQKLRNIVLNGQYYAYGYGYLLAAPIWQKVMLYGHRDLPVRYFGQPSSRVLNGVSVAIPSVTGMSVQQAIQTLSAAGFSAGAIQQKDSEAPKGTVLGTNPVGRAPKGSGVAVVVSSGVKPKPDPTESTNSSKPGNSKPTPTRTRRR
jgi:membrane peptidoglycan carboxypeptidase